MVYGSKAYRSIVKSNYETWQIFNANIKFLPTEQEVLRFEAMMNEAISASPDLLMFINPFMLMQMAKEDVKLAWMMFDNGRKKMLVHQIETTQQNQKATFDAQIESAKASEEGKQQTEQVKGEIDIAKTKMQEESSTKTALSVMFTSLMKEGGQIPPSVQPLFNAWVENNMIPMISQNEEQKSALIQQYQQAQQPIDEEVDVPQETMQQ